MCSDLAVGFGLGGRAGFAQRPLTRLTLAAPQVGAQGFGEAALAIRVFAGH